MKIAVESACVIKMNKPRQSLAYEKLGFRGSLKIPLMILNGENIYDRRLEASRFSSLSRRMG